MSNGRNKKENLNIILPLDLREGGWKPDGLVKFIFWFSYMIDINDNLSFDWIEFKKGLMHFYKLKKICFNIYYKKYILILVSSYNWWEINLGDMWESYLSIKKLNKNIIQNLKYEDIEKIGSFLSISRKWMKIRKESFWEMKNYDNLSLNN